MPRPGNTLVSLDTTPYYNRTVQFQDGIAMRSRVHVQSCAVACSGAGS